MASAAEKSARLAAISRSVFNSDEYRDWLTRAPSTSAIYDRIRRTRDPLDPGRSSVRYTYSAENLYERAKRDSSPYYSYMPQLDATGSQPTISSNWNRPASTPLSRSFVPTGSASGHLGTLGLGSSSASGLAGILTSPSLPRETTLSSILARSIASSKTDTLLASHTTSSVLKSSLGSSHHLPSTSADVLEQITTPTSASRLPMPTPTRTEHSLKLVEINPAEYLKYKLDRTAVPPPGEGLNGLLWVHLLAGRGLKSSASRPSDSYRDLYCVLECDRVHKARTVVRTGDANFDWDETFDLDLMHSTELDFLVYSWDPQYRHKLCYKGTIHLPSLMAESPLHQLALKVDPRGTLYLKIRYTDPWNSYKRLPNPRKSALFGVDLELVVGRENSGFNIPIILRRCVEEVERRGLDIIGIYRLCGSSTKKRILRDAFERNPRTVDLDADNVPDINVITGLVKDYLRELPEPLMTSSLFGMLADALAVCLPDDPEGNARLMFSILDCLPKISRCTLLYFLDHLRLVVSQADRNKMTPQNVAIVFGPILSLHADETAELDVKKTVRVLQYLLDIWPAKSVRGAAPSKTGATNTPPVPCLRTSKRTSPGPHGLAQTQADSASESSDSEPRTRSDSVIRKPPLQLQDTPSVAPGDTPSTTSSQEKPPPIPPKTTISSSRTPGQISQFDRPATCLQSPPSNEPDSDVEPPSPSSSGDRSVQQESDGNILEEDTEGGRHSAVSGSMGIDGKPGSSISGSSSLARGVTDPTAPPPIPPRRPLTEGELAEQRVRQRMASGELSCGTAYRPGISQASTSPRQESDVLQGPTTLVTLKSEGVSPPGGAYQWASQAAHERSGWEAVSDQGPWKDLEEINEHQASGMESMIPVQFVSPGGAAQMVRPAHSQGILDQRAMVIQSQPQGILDKDAVSQAQQQRGIQRFPGPSTEMGQARDLAIASAMFGMAPPQPGMAVPLHQGMQLPHNGQQIITQSTNMPPMMQPGMPPQMSHGMVPQQGMVHHLAQQAISEGVPGGIPQHLPEQGPIDPRFLHQQVTRMPDPGQPLHLMAGPQQQPAGMPSASVPRYPRGMGPPQRPGVMQGPEQQVRPRMSVMQGPEQQVRPRMVAESQNIPRLPPPAGQPRMRLPMLPPGAEDDRPWDRGGQPSQPQQHQHWSPNVHKTSSEQQEHQQGVATSEDNRGENGSSMPSPRPQAGSEEEARERLEREIEEAEKWAADLRRCSNGSDDLDLK